MLGEIIKRFKGSEFIKNSFILTFGTLIAQILPLIFYPILGRIYSPSEFGVLATITAITPILTILASGMYEGAILVAKSKVEAANIIGLIITRSILVLGIFSVLFAAYSKEISEIIKDPNIDKWLFVSPIAAFAMVVYSCFNEWCVTYKYFFSLSINKIINTSSIAIGKTLFGFFNLFGNGLVMGDLFGKSISGLTCIYGAFKFDRDYFFIIRFRKFRKLAKKYINFPKFLMTDQILNNIGGSLHIFFIGAYFDNSELGYVSMSMTLLTVPVTVISSAIKDVFRQKASREFIETGNCRSLFLKILKPLIIFTLIFFTILYFFLPNIFVIALGNQWAKSGLYSQILIPMFISNFISMSLGGVLIISNKIKVSLYWQLYTIVTSSIAFLIGIYLYDDIEITIFLFMIARTISYILYGVLSYYYAKENRKNTFEFK